MLTLKTGRILRRTSRLQGSVVGILVHNDNPRIKWRERYFPVVYAAASTAAKPGKRLVSRGRGTLAQEKPNLVDQWDRELNGSITPDTVQAGSKYKATWRCGKCCKECGRQHVWQARVSQRAGTRHACPLCSRLNVCPCQSIASLRPDLMLEWAEENPLDPQTLGCSSRTIVMWTCSKFPEHGSWSARIQNRARRNARGCPRCGNATQHRRRKARGPLRLEFPEVYAQLLPVPWSLDFLEVVTSGATTRMWWRCTDIQNRPPGCPHEHIWRATVASRCVKSTGCPFCSGNPVCPCNSIAGKARGMLAFWHFDKNTEVSPEQVGTCSCKKVWWRHICPATGEEYEWRATVMAFHRAYMQDSHVPCPKCWRHGLKERANRRPTGRPARGHQQST